MAQQIYKSWLINRWTDTWYGLSKREQDSLLEKVAGALTAAGGKSIIVCNSSWSSDGNQSFGLEVFPTLEAVQKHTQLLIELNWFRYIESSSVLGTEFTS